MLESRHSCSKVENFIGVIFLSNDIALSLVADDRDDLPDSPVLCTTASFVQQIGES